MKALVKRPCAPCTSAPSNEAACTQHAPPTASCADASSAAAGCQHAPPSGGAARTTGQAWRSNSAPRMLHGATRARQRASRRRVPDARRSPVGLKATLYTGSVCLARVCTSWPFSISHNLTSESKDAVARSSGLFAFLVPGPVGLHCLPHARTPRWRRQTRCQHRHPRAHALRARQRPRHQHGTQLGARTCCNNKNNTHTHTHTHTTEQGRDLEGVNLLSVRTKIVEGLVLLDAPNFGRIIVGT